MTDKISPSKFLMEINKKSTMYGYLFAYFCQYFQWKKDSDPKQSAIYGMVVAVAFHLFFLFTAFNFLTHDQFRNRAWALGNKYAYLPFAVAFIFVVVIIFKRNAGKMIKRYEGRDLLNIQNAIIVLALLAGPFAAGAYFLNAI